MLNIPRLTSIIILLSPTFPLVSSFLPPHGQCQEGEDEREGHAGHAGDHSGAEVEGEVAAAVAADDGEGLDLVAVEAEADPLRLRERPLVHLARVVDAAGGPAHAHHVLLVGEQPLEQDLGEWPRLMNDPLELSYQRSERGWNKEGKSFFFTHKVAHCV